MTLDELYEALLEKVQSYIDSIQEIDFAWAEKTKLTGCPETPEQLLEALELIINSSFELNKVLEHSPASIYIADEAGITLRVNKAFEEITKTDRHAIMGRNVGELELTGVFKPSVCALTMKEKRRVALLQQVNHIDGIFVTGEPVFDHEGNLFRIITNAILTEEINMLTSHINKARGKIQPEDKTEHSIIAESAAMKSILNLVDMIKDTETNVMITGETGVGKGVLANYIHSTSSRSQMPIIEINCGAIPDALLESELFGYESGAFTGADKKGKPGLLEMSDGGTLFLDEISELPLLLQVKLLHFLQNKRITRVGGTREISINTRIIAASNKFLDEQVKDGLFRSDLYYRLNVIPIVIPPLRERLEDIKPAALYFVRKFTDKYRKNLDVTDEFLDSLLENPWVGNIRELENYIERLVVTDGAGLEVDWPDAFSAERTASCTTAKKPQNLREIEKNLIMESFNKHRSSYKVAEELGISQATAYRKIKKYTEKE